MTLKTRKCKLTKKQLQEMRLDGIPYATIAERAGVSRQRVYQLIRAPKYIRDYLITKYEGKCQLCGIYVGKAGHVHHPLDEERYDDVENLMFLCNSCHRQQHTGISHINLYFKRHPKATIKDAKAAFAKDNNKSISQEELERYKNNHPRLGITKGELE